MKLIYTAITWLLCFSLFFMGCTEEISDDEALKNLPVVYLTVNTPQTASLRAAANESINQDLTDYEDRVHHLVLYVFDSKTKKLLKSENISVNLPKFIIQLTPGKRDFYFVANMQGNPSISNRDEMDNYLNTLRDLDVDLYLKATENKGFPMSRVYLEQDVTEGGTEENPTLFRPDGEDRAKLIRAVAKLELDLSQIANDVASVHYFHANKQFNLVWNSEYVPANNPTYYTGVGIDYVALTGTGGKYLFYMPEMLMPENASWLETGNNAPINYFEVIFKDNSSCKVPIITNGGTITNYLEFVKTETADFNILRNDHYKYRITKISSGIEILYSIVPWSKVKKEMYMGYWFNIETGDDGSVRIINTVDDCLPHKVTLKALNGAHFGQDPSDNEITYGYETEIPTDGSGKMKEGYFEDYKINNESVASGDMYMEVYYNGLKVKTYKK